MTTEDQLARIDALLGEVRALIAENAAQGADPWPTAPLIVADWTRGGVEGGRAVLYRETDTDQYWTIRDNESVYQEHSGDTLTNVIPVTVVPVAEWRRLRETLAAADAGDFDFFLGSFRALIAATDALGLD